MQLREYKESRAETWLNSARGLIIEDAEHSADGSHSSWTHFATVLRVKYRCFIALFVALFELGSSSVRLLWNRTFGRWNTQNKQRLRIRASRPRRSSRDTPISEAEPSNA